MHFITQSFWFRMRTSQGMYLSFAGWRCSLHPCCPSSSWHLSPLEPRCIPNEGLVNHTPVCCGKEAGGSAPWLIPSPLFPSFPSVSIPPSFCSAWTNALRFNIHQTSACPLISPVSLSFLRCTSPPARFPGRLYLWLRPPRAHGWGVPLRRAR